MKSFLKKICCKFFWLFNRFPFNNKYRLRGTKIKNSGKSLFGCKFLCQGKGNVIIFHSGGIIRNTIFRIKGDNNIIEIGSGTSISHGDLHIEDEGNRICIGKNTSLMGKVHIACVEGKSVTIGDDCLLSSEIVFRTSDSHSLLDLEGNRINPAADIVLGNHIWIGYRALINKGVTIASNNMIGTGAIVTKSFEKSNTVIAGVPARVVKEDTDWCVERI